MALTEEIKDLAGKCLADDSQFIVDIVVSSGKTPGKVLVIVDGDRGISIDDCAEVSTKLANALDDSGLMVDNPYLLEVSTPGLDQPLKLKRQFQKNIGRKLKVRLADKSLEGLLESMEDDTLSISVVSGKGKKKEVQVVRVPLEAIENAFVLISFK